MWCEKHQHDMAQLLWQCQVCYLTQWVTHQYDMAQQQWQCKISHHVQWVMH